MLPPKQTHTRLNGWLRGSLAMLAMLLSPGAWAGVDWVVNSSDTGFDPVPAGGDIVYVVRVNNNGDTPAPATSLTLALPATTVFVSATGMTCSGSGPVTCAVPALTAGGGGGDEATVDVRVRTTISGVVTLTASVPTAGDDDASNNAVNESTTVNAGADIALALTGPASAASGATVSYTYTITNNGPDASGTQTLNVPQPAGLSGIVAPGGCTLSGSSYTCSVAGLANGASTTRVFTGQISAASGSTLTASGSVTATATPADPIASNNTATFNTTVTPGSDVRIAKSRAPGGALVVGQAVTFTLTPSYTGDSPSGLTITDTLPANYTPGVVASPQNGWTCSVSGQTITCTKPAGSVAGASVALGTIAIPATAASAGSGVTNTATIASSGPADPNPANNTASDGGVTINAATVDLRANKSGPSPAVVVAGQAFNWTISASNIGTAGFVGTLVMTDNLPAGVTVNGYTLNGWSCSPAAPVSGPAAITCQRVFTAGSPLAAGATSSAVVLDAVASSPGSHVNSMTVSSPDANIPDTNPGNDTVTHAVTASLPADAADLSVTKAVSPASVAAGEVLTYTLEVINSGPQPADTVTLTDALGSLINNSVGPTGAGYIGHILTPGSSSGGSCSSAANGSARRDLTCTFSSIPVCTAGVDCPVIVVQIRPGGNGGSRSNTASVVSAVTADPDAADRTATVVSTVTPRVDVTVSKTATPASVPAGQNLTYVITASNIANGQSQANNVLIDDTLPHGVRFVSASPSSGLCATVPAANSVTGPGNDQLACNLGSIANGAQQTVTVVVQPTTATRGITLTNTAFVSTSTDETNIANNSASVNTTVQNPTLDLLINKTDSVDPVAAGDNTVYTITVTNQGPSAAENVTVTDNLPPTRLSYQSHTVPAGGTCPTVPALNSTNGTLVCQIPVLAAGQSASLTVTMRGEVKGVDINTATVSSDEVAAGFDTVAGNNSVNQNTTVRTKADVQVVSKTPSANPVNLRDVFDFVIRVRNNTGPGLAEADGVVVSDTLPANMQLAGTPVVAVVSGTASSTTCTGTSGSTSFTCSLGTLSSGGEVDVTVPVRAVAVTSNPQVFNNTASVSTTSLDVNPANNSNSGSVAVNSSSLAGRVFRDFNNDGVVTVGDTGIAGIVMTLTGTSFDGATINRTAASDASGNFSFAFLPAGTYTLGEGAVSEAHLVDGNDTAGTAGGSTAVNDVISAINLPANTAATGYLFAEVPHARIGIAKAVQGAIVVNGDATFNATFRLTVRNFSLETLNAISVSDALAGAAPAFGNFVAGGAAAALGNGDYTIQAAPSGSCGGLNPAYDGSGATTVASGFVLAAGASCTIDFTVRARPTAPQPSVSGVCGGRYCNQASVTGAGALSGQAPADSSDDGVNPDTNNNGIANEAGENDPTPVSPNFGAAIGVAKRVNTQVALQPDGSLVVPIRVVVANVGNEPLNTIAVSDPLSGAVGGDFGNFVAGGAAASLVAGQYTVEAAPAFSGACAGGTPQPGYTGHSGNTTLATIANLATGAACMIDFSFRFRPGAALTYTNQASANATGDFTGSPASDLSDDGANPDPNANGNAGDPGENDPTPIPVPRIGVAKSAGAVVNHGDGTYSVQFTLTVTNAGQTPLNNVQLADTLAGALPGFGNYTASAIPSAGQYTVVGAPAIVSQTNGASLTPVAAGVFTGSGGGNALLVGASSSLPNVGASASSAQVRFTVRFFPTTPGPFENRAVSTGAPPGGGTVADDSVDGAIPDANGNGTPNDDTSPTVVNLAAQSIGIAKSVAGVVQTGTKRFAIPYTLVVRNLSATTTATNVQIDDDLVAAFPAAASRSIVSAPAVSACTGTVLNPNPAFDGVATTSLLAGNQNLQAGEQCTVRFTVEIDFGSNPLPAAVQNNQASATTAQTPGGTIITSDLSDNGANPDSNGNGNGNEAGENDPTPVNFGAGGLASVSGKVYLDANHDRVDNDGAPNPANVQGFIVEILNSTGTVVGSATTDAAGQYVVHGLFPSTPGDAATRYSLRFRDPVNGAIWGLPQSGDPNPARNGTISNGVIVGLELAAGVTTLEQNLPLDPSGVVYDSVTRAPVAGAQVTLLNGGVPVAGTCLVGGVNAQTTGPSGMYQFLLLNPAPGGCPGSGTYTLAVVQPGGYLPPNSTIIPPAAGAYTPTTGGTDAIQPQPGAPVGAASTLYYTSFVLTLSGNAATSSSNVVNNHIPLDPVLGGAIALTKTTPLVNVSVGQLVPYTITARNTLSAALSNIDLRDTLPPGFKYKPGSATLDGVALEPTVNGRVLVWPNLTFAANASRTLKLLLVVGAGVQPGEYVNSAHATNNLVPPPNSNAVSNVATATVRVVPDPTFDCSDLIGKVFDDKNANGYQDAGEPGIANVRLATARGWLVTTDAEGRFHVACAAIPDADRGSNFVMKLDERTLPTGYRVTTENPRDVRLTRGKLSKLNFGATLHKVVRVDMGDAAFESGKTALKPDWAKQLAALPGKLKARPSVLRLAYKVGADGEALARERLDALNRQIKTDWKRQACCPALLIEEELFLPVYSGKEGK